MERFIKAASSDLLADAVPESLKNMLLVMDTAGIFVEDDNKKTTPIWDLSWEKLATFLPNLMPDLFGDRSRGTATKSEDRLKNEAEAKPQVEPKEVIKPQEEPKEVTKPPEPIQIVKQQDENQLEKEKPPELQQTEKPLPSPIDPPAVNPAFFAQDNVEKPKLNLPPPPQIKPMPLPPKIEPMPPPPAGIEPIILRQQNFQPIQIAAPSQSASVPLVNPRPVIAAAPSGDLSSYFPVPSNAAPTGNILTAAFTPTVVSNTVFVGESSSAEKK